MNDLFENACLIQLKTSCWTGAKQVPDVVMADLGAVNPQWLKGKKHLVNPEYLAPIKTELYKARKELVSQALPFPISTLFLVPREAIMGIEQRLQTIKRAMLEEVALFAAHYETACQEAKLYLGDQYCSLDYPQTIETKFRMEWRFVTLSVPNQASVLPVQLYEAERDKFMALMQEARELAVLSLRQEFSGIVTHLVERLSEKDGEKPKIIRTDMFDRFQEFWTSFSTRNLFQDQELTQLVEQAKACMEGVDVQQIKNNSLLKSQMADAMTTLKTQIDAAIDTMPRRQIRFTDIGTPFLPACIAA